MNQRMSYFVLTCMSLGLAFLYIPILSMIVFSFNASRLVTVWDSANSPTLKWYFALLGNEEAWTLMTETAPRQLAAKALARGKPVYKVYVQPVGASGGFVPVPTAGSVRAVRVPLNRSR